MKLKRIGWVGYVNDKPYWEEVMDDYDGLNEPGAVRVEVFKTKREARKRFEDVREVFVKE